MEFEVKFEKDAELYFQFSDGEMEAVDAAAEEAVPVLGQITADGEEIGQIILYELYNDELFYQKCDELSGDCETVAEAICGKKRARTGEASRRSARVRQHLYSGSHRNRPCLPQSRDRLCRHETSAADAVQPVRLRCGDFSLRKRV